MKVSGQIKRTRKLHLWYWPAGNELWPLKASPMHGNADRIHKAQIIGTKIKFEIIYIGEF